VILVLVIAIAIAIAGLAVVVVGPRLTGSSGVDGSRPESELAPAQPSVQSDQSVSPAEQDDSATETPVGRKLEGPLAARMDRWQPVVGGEGPSRTPPVRSSVVDTPVRVVSEGAQGFDGVAARIARRRWDELTTGITELVPPVVWESARRALPEDGALLSIHAVIDSYQPEYIVRYETERVLLRLYTSGSQVDDMEIEELPSPHR